MATSRKARPASAAEMRRALRDAAQDDERNSIKEEYRLAEEKRREREDQKRIAAEAAARLDEERRQLEEAGLTPTREESAQLKEKLLARSHELQRQRAGDAALSDG